MKVSEDAGLTWQKIAEIRLPDKYDERYGYSLFRLPEGDLVCGVACRDHFQFQFDRKSTGMCTLMAYRRSDGGKTWEGPSKIADWCHEGGIARTASGRLLAVLRYQRPLLPGDPPGLMEQTGGRGDWAYKHVFLADSVDGGRTWSNVRQLTTVFGQCYARGVGLADGTVVVVHDCRYGPGAPSNRLPAINRRRAVNGRCPPRAGPRMESGPSRRQPPEPERAASAHPQPGRRP